MSVTTKELHARTLSAVDRVLRNHGVSLNGSELQHVSAELADFVAAEVEHAITAAAETEEPDEEDEKAKRRTKR